MILIRNFGEIDTTFVLFGLKTLNPLFSAVRRPFELRFGHEFNRRLYFENLMWILTNLTWIFEFWSHFGPYRYRISIHSFSKPRKSRAHRFYWVRAVFTILIWKILRGYSYFGLFSTSKFKLFACTTWKYYKCYCQSGKTKHKSMYNLFHAVLFPSTENIWTSR